MPSLPLDMPDDYPWLPSSTRYPLADLGEQAVRLGSPVTFDRRGEVVWFDVGDRGLSPYICNQYGTGAIVRPVAVYTLHGGYAIQLVAGSNGDHAAEIAKIISNLQMQRGGLEVAFHLPTYGDAFDIEVRHYTGAVSQRGVVRIDYADDKMKYLGDDDNFHEIATIGTVATSYWIYHHSKVVVDFDANRYMRLLFDDERYDLSAYALNSVASAEQRHYWLSVRMTGRLTYNDAAYVGHVILTGNEP